MTDLEKKAISIKGKMYVQVKDRVIYFNDNYPNGRITTELVSNEGDEVVVKAIVIPDVKNPDRYFTGYSQANKKQGMINRTSAMENCETSAVGRALGMMGIGVLDGMASADEMYKAGLTKDEEVLEAGLEDMKPTTCPIHKGRKFEHRIDYLGEGVYGHFWDKDDGSVAVCLGKGFRDFKPKE